KHEYPYQVHKVPVKTYFLNHFIPVPPPDIESAGHIDGDDRQKKHSGENVETVKSGNEEKQGSKSLRAKTLLGNFALVRSGSISESSMHPLTSHLVNQIAVSFLKGLGFCTGCVWMTVGIIQINSIGDVCPKRIGGNRHMLVGDQF